VSERRIQPLYLLADSQLLFWKTTKGPFFAAICETLTGEFPNVAYVGASNGDSPEAYAILTAALEQVQHRSVHRVSASFTSEDREVLEAADVVILAGGDVEAGWDVFKTTGLRDAIVNRFRNGATLVGVSAGAVQFGTHAALRTDADTCRLVEMFGFVRLIVDVHNEEDEWRTLSSTIHLLEGAAVGVGIPKGAGLVVHPDGVLEPVRQNVDEFIFDNGKVRHAILVPDLPR
jgi:cyanophycinase